MGMGEWSNELRLGTSTRQDGSRADESEKDSEAQGRMQRLVRTIEGEIVPRLLVSRRIKVTTAAKPRGNVEPDLADVREMVRLLLAHEPSVASSYVEALRQRGATLEMICLDLLAPSARELGHLWEEDECDFMQVTVGLCRLHMVLRELSPAFDCEDYDHDGDRRILLIPYPGEQHTFGITLVAQFLRRAGWDVWQESPATTAELLAITRETSFAAVGISVGCETLLEGLTDTISAIRKSTRNRSIGILVGGPMFVAKPQLIAAVGADATAVDGRDAVVQAERVRAGLHRQRRAM